MSEIEELVQQMVELQTQVAFQEDTVSVLNNAVTAQQKEILVLREQLELLKQRQDETIAQVDQAGLVVDEKPPHY